MRLYGLKSCDTCRKALKELAAAGQDVEFVDVRANPLPADLIARLVAQEGERAVNKRSRTWSELSEADRALPPEVLIARHPVVMKRPLVTRGDEIYLGWADAVASALSR